MVAQLPDRACDTCGEALTVDGQTNITVLELPYRAVEQLEDYYPEITRQLDQGDGKLVYHTECGHPIEDLLPREEEMADYDVEDAGENMATCPVCEVAVIAARERCGRCGASLEADA